MQSRIGVYFKPSFRKNSVMCFVDAIKLISENGDRYYALCRRIDECHVKIDGVRWHLQAYAQAMEKRGIIFMPAKNNL